MIFDAYFLTHIMLFGLFGHIVAPLVALRVELPLVSRKHIPFSDCSLPIVDFCLTAMMDL